MYPINRVVKVRMGDDYEFMVCRHFVKTNYAIGYICEDADGFLNLVGYTDIQFVDGDAAQLLKGHKVPIEPIPHSHLENLIQLLTIANEFYCLDETGKSIRIVDHRIKVNEDVDRNIERSEILVFYDSEGNEYLPGDLYWEVKDDRQKTPVSDQSP